MSNRTAKSFCRICPANCGMTLTIDEDDHIVDIRGDKDQPNGYGYACFKGLQAEEAHHGPQRLLRPLKRSMNNTYSEILLDEALDEIADRLSATIKQNGSRAVALFLGSGGAYDASNLPMGQDFLRAIGSDQLFTGNTIDQSAKGVSFERLGAWSAGVPSLEESDVVLLIGTNPLIAHSTTGLMSCNATRRMKAATSKGLTLICIDPRRTETARYGELFLQPLPGHDAAIVSALIRIILDNNWHDAEFCERHVGADRLQQLRTAVGPFTPEFVEHSADLKSGQLYAVAATFARDNKKGAAFAATGPSMAPFSNLTQHLVDVLNVVCGRFRRTGERIPASPLTPPAPVYAEVIEPPRGYKAFPPSRIRGVGRLLGERLSATLADEILTLGEGQIKALIVSGGNPANCMPDQRRMVEAIQSLELSVVIDPYMSVTAQLADFVIPPLMMYERPDLPIVFGSYVVHTFSWGQYTPAVLRPPADSELIASWRFYWEIARRLGAQITYEDKVKLDMENAPTTDDLLAIRLNNAAVSLEELKRYPSGHVFDFDFASVLPPRPEARGRFDVMPDDVAEEMAQLAARESQMSVKSSISGRACTHFLAPRRASDTHNSQGTNLQTTLKRLKRLSYNPAFLNPGDMLALGLESGDEIEIASTYGKVKEEVRPDHDVRCGVLSITHGWGGLPNSDEGLGTSINLLTNCHLDYEPINAMPHMSGIPVSIVKLTSNV